MSDDNEGFEFTDDNGNHEYDNDPFKYGGDGESRRKQKKSKEDKLPEEYVQKYSNANEIIESILIGNEPYFLIAKNGKIRVSEFYPTSIILKPYEPNSYINRPYAFKSFEEIKALIENSKDDLDTLYRTVKSIWKKYIDADDFHIIICAADTIFTYFQDKIGLTHYLFFVGNNGSGKSNNLKVLNLLAYRNMLSTDLTHANIYQFLGSDQEGVGTICEDEADGIDEDRVKMGTYKNGYTTGFPVFRMLETTSSKRKQTRLNTFCFKAFAAEKLPDSIKAKGFNERVLQIFCTYGFPEHDITEVVNPAGEQKFQTLLDELNEVRNKLLIYRLKHYHDAFPDINLLDLQNREKQLFKPLLRIFQKTETLNELLPVISEFVKSKRRTNANTLHAFLYEMIKDLIKRRNNSYVLDSRTIWEFITDPQVLSGEPIPNKSMSYYSTEFGPISQKQIIEIYMDVFGAKKPPHHGSSNKLIFDENKLNRLGRIYELSLDIKVKASESESNTKANSKESGIDGIDGIDVQQGSPIIEDYTKEETSNNCNNSSNNDKEIDNIDTQTINEDSKNMSLSPVHPPHLSHPPQIEESSTKNWDRLDDKNDNPSHLSQISFKPANHIHIPESEAELERLKHNNPDAKVLKSLTESKPDPRPNFGEETQN